MKETAFGFISVFPLSLSADGSEFQERPHLIQERFRV